MSKHHLTYFKVENFKRFDSLELADIGQFNMIVGDNNVGKTTLLEAISSIFEPQFDVQDKKLHYLNSIVYLASERGLNFQGNTEAFANYIARLADKPILFQWKRGGQGFDLWLSSKLSQIGVTLFESSPGHTMTDSYPLLNANSKNEGSNFEPPFVRAFMLPDIKLDKQYQSALNYSTKNKRLILKNLQIIDKQIVDIEVLPIVFQPHVMISFESQDKILPISSLGDSVVRVFYYLLMIIKNKGKFLLIDEIESGIHYSRLKPVLKNIFQLAIENDIQLFLTTHSLECQQAFAEIFEDDEMLEFQSKVRQYSLLETDQGNVVANGYNFDQLKNALDIGFETRGGKDAW